MNEAYYYVNIPRQLLDDLADGKITPGMFHCMIWLYRWADWKTGVVKWVSASRIAEDMWPEGIRLNTVREYLRLLGLCGYIRSDYKQGSRKNYSVTIMNFQSEKIPINPHPTVGYKEFLRKGVSDAVSDAVSDTVSTSLPHQNTKAVISTKSTLSKYVGDSICKNSTDPSLPANSQSPAPRTLQDNQTEVKADSLQGAASYIPVEAGSSAPSPLRSLGRNSRVPPPAPKKRMVDDPLFGEVPA